MSSGRKVSPTQPSVGSTVANARASRSSRSSPYSSSSGADYATMAASSFLPPLAHPGRTISSAFQMNKLPGPGFDHEGHKSQSAMFNNSVVEPSVRVLIRRLPLNTSEQTLHVMFGWVKELSDVELLPVEQSEDDGFRSALLRFKSMTGALEVKSMLDGSSKNSKESKDAEMIVEILNTSPSSRRLAPAVGPSHLPNSNGHVSQGSRQMSHFNVFPSHDKISPTSNGGYPPHDFTNSEPNVHYQNIFTPQPPIGGHLTDRTRVSGKSLINNDYADDDETSDLLKDPVAYAENSATSQRRATAPQIPVNRMANLSLNTSSSPPGPSSLPPYMNSLSPVSASAPGMNYPMGAPNFPRHNFPPVNPADQNPPCNTLYVGNLPIDTSEEELKAMFSKQRGYKRLCFRTKQNGPMCFVEFEDVSFATKALHELYGQPLHNSVKGGIRLSFSKNPLGVRSGQASSQPPAVPMPSVNGNMPGPSNAFTSATGPPPGLAAPPGLGTGRTNYTSNGGGNRHYPFLGFPSVPSSPWNASGFSNEMGTTPNGAFNPSSNFMPRHMMGR